MRLAFLGTPEFATIPLRALVEAGHEIALVVTQPDRKRGRGTALSPTPVKRAAGELGLPVSHDMGDVLGLDIDRAVVAAFGRLIPDELLAHVEHLNIHPSLLPRWRGAAPVEHTILGGDTETGVCVIRLVREMDAGPIHRVVRTPVGEREHASDLLVRLFEIGSDELIALLAGDITEPVEQIGEATHARKFGPDDTRLDWTLAAEQLDRIVRTDRGWTTFRGKRLHVLDAAPLPPSSATFGRIAPSEVTFLPKVDGRSGGGPVVAVGCGGGGVLELSRVKMAGRPAMTGGEWARGARIEAGEGLG